MPSAAFGSVTIGATSPATTFTVTNAGTAASGALSTTLGGTDAASFDITSDTCSGVLHVGGSCQVGITFSPTTAGTMSASLTVTGDPGATVTSDLSGTGVALGALAISATTNTLGSVVVGQTGTTTSTFTVMNTGGSASGAVFVQANGTDPGDFVTSDDLCSGQTLAAAASCTFVVSFVPREAGMRSATFDVSGNPGGSVNGAISGIGIAPARLVAAPSNLAFGSVATGETTVGRAFVIVNVGGETTSALARMFGGTDADSFSTIADQCVGETLAPGASCTVTVVFTGGGTGPQVGHITYDGAPGGSVTVTLAGVSTAADQLVINPTTHAFPHTLTSATSATQSFTVTNNAAVASGILATGLIGAAPGQFRVTSNTCDGNSLPPTAQCSIEVAFAPTANGLASASLSVSSGAAGSVTAALSGLGLGAGTLTITPSSRNFGTVATGAQSSAQTFTVTNVGGQTTGVPVAALGGANMAEFTLLANTCTVALAPLESCTVQVQFAPTTAGAATASIGVTADPGSATAALTGVAVAPGELLITPTTFSFPTTAIGDTAVQAFTVHNPGTATTGTIGVTMTTGNTGDFISSSTCTTLGAGDSCTVTVTFQPTESGARATTLQASATPGGTATAGLSGSARPRLEIIALDDGPVVPVFDFGPGVIDNTNGREVQITVRNNTSTEAPFTAIDAFGTPAQYATVSNTCQSAGTIGAAGGTCLVRVRFAPTSVGPQARSISFSIGAGAVNGATQDLTGTGTGSLSITALDGAAFGAVPQNTPAAARTFRVTNAVGSPTSGPVTTNLTGAAYEITANGCTGQPLTGGASCLIDVSFTPTTVGAANGTLGASATPGGAPTIELTGSGSPPTGAAPTDLAVTPSSVEENQAAGATVGMLSATDADAGDTFTFTLVSGTGSTDNGSFAISGSTLVTAASFDFETKASYAIRVRVRDSGSQIFEKVLTITVTNVDEAPVAVNDFATVDEDSDATALTVLANDTDVDGGPMTITAVTQGANGVVVITGGGTGLTYAPAANYAGPDSFTYTLNGGSVGTVTITVTAIDDPPVAVMDLGTVTEDDPATPIDVLFNDLDIDGGPMTITAVTQGTAGGTVAITGGGLGLTYRPHLDYSGFDTFTYTLNGGSTTTVTIDVVGVDDPPTAVIDSATTNEDTEIAALDVIGNDVDVDGDPISVSSVTQPANGAVTINPNSTLTYTPAANFNGVDTFTYTLDGGSSAQVSITVTAVNDAPVNSVPGTQTTNEDTAQVFSTANSNVITISDLDATTAQVTLSATNGTITLPVTTDLAFTTGDGTADATMVFTGTIETINLRLNGLSFLPNLDVNGDGAASLQIITNDQGSTGLGGPLTDTDSISFNVTAAQVCVTGLLGGVSCTSTINCEYVDDVVGTTCFVPDCNTALGLPPGGPPLPCIALQCVPGPDVTTNCVLVLP